MDISVGAIKSIWSVLMSRFTFLKKNTYTSNERGSSLIVLLIIILIISVVTARGTGILIREYKNVNDSYLSFITSSAAESAIELAKAELFTKKKFNNGRLVFNYGNKHFNQVLGTTVQCEVTAYIKNDRLFMESVAKLYLSSVNTKQIKKTDNNSPPIVIKRVKTLLKVINNPFRITHVWLVRS